MECAERLNQAIINSGTKFNVPDVHGPVTDTKQLGQCVFFLRKVLTNVDIDVHQRDLQCFLNHLNGSVVLRELSQALSSVDEGYRRAALAKLMTKVLTVEFVCRLLTEQQLSRQQARNMSHLITNLPAHVSNAVKLDVPEFFHLSRYPLLLVKACCMRISALAEDLRQNRDASLGLLSALVGKLGVHCPMTFDVLVPFFLSQPEDFIFRRVVQRLIVGLPTDLQENAIVLICYRTPCYRQMDWLLEDSITRESNIKHILVKKLLLGRYFANDRVLKNVVGYLCSSGRRKDIASEALLELCHTWSDKVLMKYQTIEQQKYLTCALLTFVGFMKAEFVLEDSSKDKCVQTLLHGVQNHLSDPDEVLRNYGMLVGREFLAVVRSEVKRPDFTIRLADYEDLMSFMDTPSEVVTPQTVEPDEAQSSKTGTSKPAKVSIDSDDDSEPNDDDDDIVYQIDPKCKIPLYLRDCLRLMVPGSDGENIEQAKICLEHLPQLILRCPDELRDTAVDLCRMVLYAQECPKVFPQIVPLKRESLVLLLIHAPVPSSGYLIEQFYSVHVNHTQRLEILAAITLASDRYAKEAPVSKKRQTDRKTATALKGSDILKQIDRLTVEPRKLVAEWTSDDFDDMHTTQHEQDLQQHATAVVERHWREVVEERVSAKTRKIASKTEISTEENRFGEVAGHFFYPLMRSFTNGDVSLRMDDVDSFLLVQLLKTLGVVMSSARHTPRALQMGKALLHFASAFQYHDHEAVRQACSFAIASVFRSVPEEMLDDENQLGLEAAELGPWLDNVATKVPSLDVKLPTSSTGAVLLGPSPLSTRRIQELT